MAEKGGKGFPIVKKKVAVRARPLASKQASMDMHDTPMEEDGFVQIDSSDSESEGFVNRGNGISSEGNGKASKETTKTGKKVAFDGLKTGAKSSLETPSIKGDSGKGGKAYTAGKAGGKGGLPQSLTTKPPISELELKLEMDLPKNARVLMDCEAGAILQGIQESLAVLSDDPNIHMSNSFEKALQYCKASNRYTNSESVRQVLESLREHEVTEGEICMIGNVCPESIDEVYALIPSLKATKHKNERPIREVLDNLASFMRT